MGSLVISFEKAYDCPHIFWADFAAPSRSLRETMIELANVSRSFDGIEALAKMSLKVPKGSLTGIIGPGGSGKSTAVKVMCGLIRPDSGKVLFDQTDLMSIDRAALRGVQARFGIQFQNDALFEHLSVLQNVMYPLERLTRMRIGQMRARAIERIAMVGLAGFEDRLPNHLSGGQRRRVAVARACVTDPDVLICDDPTAGLDPVTSRKILDMIIGIRYQTKNTVIIVSSDVLGLMSVADRVALVWDGAVTAEGAPHQFWQDDTPRVRRFLDDARLPFEVLGWQ